MFSGAFSRYPVSPTSEFGLKGFEGPVEELVTGYFLGHQVLEIRWVQGKDGWRTQAIKVVPPRFFGYPTRRRA